MVKHYSKKGIKYLSYAVVVTAGVALALFSTDRAENTQVRAADLLGTHVYADTPHQGGDGCAGCGGGPGCSGCNGCGGNCGGCDSCGGC